MKRVGFSLFLMALSLFSLLSGCRGAGSHSNGQAWKEWTAPNGHVKALATIAMIADLVKQVGGPYVDVLTLMQGELDPHSYQLVKGDDEKLLAAQVIFYNGLGLEHGPSLHSHLIGNPKAIGLGDVIRKENPQLILTYQEQVDPHIWMDISLWSQTVPTIVAELTRLDPEHGPEYKKNGELLIQKMMEAHERIKAEVHQIPEQQRYLVTSHDAFNYFARAYLAEDGESVTGEWQKRFAAPEGLAPESQLSAREVQNILDFLKKYQVHVLFPESNLSKDAIRKIVEAGKANGLNVMIAKEFLYGDAMGRSGSDGDTHIKMIEHNARVIVFNLSRKE